MSINPLQENIIYKTKLSKANALKKLVENTAPEKPFGVNSPDNGTSKPYIGNIQANTFEIKRIITYANAFIPTITGEISNDYEGTKIQITMKPNRAVLAFMAIWFSIVILVCIITVFLLYTQEFTLFFIIPFAMLIFGIVVLFGAFKTETKKSSADLKTIFEAEIG